MEKLQNKLSEDNVPTLVTEHHNQLHRKGKNSKDQGLERFGADRGATTCGDAPDSVAELVERN